MHTKVKKGVSENPLIIPESEQLRRTHSCPGAVHVIEHECT